MPVRYVLHRLLALAGTIVGVSVLVFLLTTLLPGDPATASLGVGATQEQIETRRDQLGLDEPIPVRYATLVANMLHGDFGVSVVTHRPITEDLLRFYPATIELTLCSLLVALAIGVPMGILAAVRFNRPADHFARVVSIMGAAVPIFWLGLVLQVFLYGELGWFPAGGRIDRGELAGQITGFLILDSILQLDFGALVSALRHLALPVVTLSGLSLATVVRITRSSMLDTLDETYVTVARTKGLRERKVLLQHALRNAANPIMTIAGLRFGHLLSGAVVTETIFAWPGVGRYAVDAMLNNDYLVIVAFTITVTALYATVNLIVDLLVSGLDPRIRVGG